MKKSFFLASILTLSAAFTACVSDADENQGPKTVDGDGMVAKITQFSDIEANPGVIRVKLTPEAIENFAVTTTRSGEIETGIGSLDEIVQSLGAVKMERTFRHGGKFEKQMQKAGLHLWYEIYFDETVPVTRASSSLSHLGSKISVIEPSLPIVRTNTNPDLGPVGYAKSEAPKPETRADVQYPFDDPGLPLQWHYNNSKQQSTFVEGADINLFRAWEVETGSPEVIVAITDGGIDINHEDIKANLWRNEAEINGVPGRDDDGNGYVDDKYGWNFVYNTSNVTGDQHGTHVAGTVAAVNNNGIGVSGVAGGDGTNPGVKVMSCQIFQGDNGVAEDIDFKNAFIYAANNGAVISQNSWGYGLIGPYQRPLQDSDKEAIDYFTDHAGMDEEGNQTGPMKGGIVIFAAGNDGLGGLAYPGAYERAFSVAAMAPDYKKAYYTNYGAWVDIFAPGGDYNYTNGKVYSTCVKGYSDGVYYVEYDWMQGTSMACPHVSGIAALVVSRYGGPGFTNDKLWTILSESLSDVDIYKYNTGFYNGKLGAGLIDAYKAVTYYETPGNTPPEPVTDLKATWTADSATLTWSVTCDAEDGKATKYEIISSMTDLTGVDFDNPPAYSPKETVEVGSLAVGAKITKVLSQLRPSTTFYIAISALDTDGNRSSTMMISGKTMPNLKIAKSKKSIPLYINSAAAPTQMFAIDMEQSGEWTFTVTEKSAAVTDVIRNGDDLVVTFDTTKIAAGEYNLGVVVRAENGSKEVVNIKYIVE